MDFVCSSYCCLVQNGILFQERFVQYNYLCTHFKTYKTALPEYSLRISTITIFYFVESDKIGSIIKLRNKHSPQQYILY